MRKSKPSEEIQSLLDMLFVQDYDIFKGLHINLRRSRLNGADLQGAHLEKADLSGAYLRGADLREAYLQGADLSGAHLQGAILYRANLQGALLRGTQFQGADLSEAQLQGSLLPRAQFQGANLSGADMRGASSQGNLSYTYAQRMRRESAEESTLAGAMFEGGLSREYVDSIVEGLSDEKARALRGLLEGHIDGEVKHHPRENSGAITGTYTAKEAEQWIAEYEEVMSVFNEADDN